MVQISRSTLTLTQSFTSTIVIPLGAGRIIKQANRRDVTDILCLAIDARDYKIWMISPSMSSQLNLLAHLQSRSTDDDDEEQHNDDRRAALARAEATSPRLQSEHVRCASMESAMPTGCVAAQSSCKEPLSASAFTPMISSPSIPDSRRPCQGESGRLAEQETSTWV